MATHTWYGTSVEALTLAIERGVTADNLLTWPLSRGWGWRRAWREHAVVLLVVRPHHGTGEMRVLQHPSMRLGPVPDPPTTIGRLVWWTIVVVASVHLALAIAASFGPPQQTISPAVLASLPPLVRAQYSATPTWFQSDAFGTIVQDSAFLLTLLALALFGRASQRGCVDTRLGTLRGLPIMANLRRPFAAPAVQPAADITRRPGCP